MKPRAAWIGSAAFLLLAPGTVAGLIPYLLTGWESHTDSVVARVAGALLLAAAVPVLLGAFLRFVREGRGTPAPVAPTDELVVGGLYRYVRNPMYLAVVGAIVGQALLLGRPELLAYAAVVGGTTFAFVKVYEEPTLSARYGERYDHYRAEVPGWWPHL
jgi:protein-S-isoprenylcysteine O-methyltransferase Ste14